MGIGFVASRPRFIFMVEKIKTEIKLGDEVKCKYTGVKGIVLSKSEFINGCTQFGITPKFNPKIALSEATAEISIDSQSLIIIKKGAGHEKEWEDEEEPTGGARRLKYKI